MPPPESPAETAPSLLGRFPVYYGWVVVAVAFLTIGVGVNVRTAFSLLYPPILAEFGWDKGVTAGIFSVGFASSMVLTPFLGLAINRFGPGLVMSAGSIFVGAGLILTTQISSGTAGGTAGVTSPLLLYLSLGCSVIGGSIIFAYTSHAFFLPNWFARRRGLAIGLAFAGAGIGSIILFPWLQGIIKADGWRDACWAMAIVLLALVLPANLFFQRRRPEDLGLKADGDGRRPDKAAAPTVETIVDRNWAERDWSLRSAARTARFWWTSLGLFFGMWIWYSVQVHQTQYLGEVGFDAETAAYALGMVSLIGIAGQIGLGAFSDRFGREWAWTLSALGFGICYLLLIAMKGTPSPVLLWGMVAAQGALGYGLSSVFPSIMAELFQSRRYGQIFGGFGVVISLGAAVGPWLTGALWDWTGSYDAAWFVAIGGCGVSIAAMWLAAPRKVRLAAGVARRRAMMNARA